VSKTLLKAIGPGLLMACAAIGASHLLWSTRAGAIYGWSLAGIILAINFLKFPFFYYGHRYSAATGESLLAGYLRLGKPYLFLFVIVSFITGGISIAGVSMLTGAIMTGFGFWPEGLKDIHLGLGIMLVCAALVFFGRYRAIDKIAKTVMTVLVVLTIGAVIMAIIGYTPPPGDFVSAELLSLAGFTFLIYLIGWMPAPVDVSSWSSLWMFGREKETGHRASVRETTIDFTIGYTITALLAVGFVALGTLLIYGRGIEMPVGGAGFTQQLVGLYAASIGEWSRPIILGAAFLTIASTTITVLDGYPRSVAAGIGLLAKASPDRFRLLNQILLGVMTGIGAYILLVYVQNLLQLLQWAATAAFLTSPILAWFNFKAMRSPHVPAEFRPGPLLTLVSWLGLAFFVLSTGGFLWILLVG
jgi:Mn2+/Fe2+ NRAMP family transporter